MVGSLARAAALAASVAASLFGLAFVVGNASVPGLPPAGFAKVVNHVPVVRKSPIVASLPASPRPPTWTNVINDQFNSGTVPDHWRTYDGPYGSGANNCAVPSHAAVSGGVLHLLMRYEPDGLCGAGWYTAGMEIAAAYEGIDQRVTVRFRVVRSGAASHFIIPMRLVTDESSWPAGGEEDYCETDVLSGCETFLHHGTDNSQVEDGHTLDLSQWHVLRFQRRDHVVSAFIDDMKRPAWTYDGSSATLPDTLKRTVLQQECQASCPEGTTGTEDLQIDWITIDDAR